VHGFPDGPALYIVSPQGFKLGRFLRAISLDELPEL